MKRGKIVKSQDTRGACWSRVDLASGEPVWISISQTGVLVKRSRMGLFGATLFKEGDVGKVSSMSLALEIKHEEQPNPEGMTHPILRVFTKAALAADTAAELSTALHKALENRDSVTHVQIAGLAARSDQLSKELRLSDQAKDLVNASNVFAVDSFAHLSQEFPSLEAYSEDLANWDYFATVLGVGIAFMQIHDNVPGHAQEHVCNLVAAELNKWDQNGYSALENCVTFINKNIGGDAEVSDLFGYWLLANLKEDRLTEQELLCVRGIGRYFFEAFLDWWD